MKPYEPNRPDWYKRLSSGPFAERTFTERHIDETIVRLRSGRMAARPTGRIKAWGAAAVVLAGILVFAVIRGQDWLPMSSAGPKPPGQVTTSPSSLPTGAPSSTPTASPTPTTTTINISEAQALDIAKKSQSSPEASWSTTFMSDFKPNPDQGKSVPAWMVSAVFPAGNKDIFYIDAMTGQILMNSEVEAPGSGMPFSNAADQLRALRMIDSKHGWALNWRGVWHTSTGPDNWQNVSPQGAVLGVKPNGPEIMPGAAFMDDASAVVAVPSEKGSTVSVYATKDAGVSWNKTDVKTGLSESDVPMVKSMTFSDASHGWMLLSFGVAMGSEFVEIYGTSDGGLTWEKTAGNKQNEAETKGLPLGGLKDALVFADGQHGYLTGFSYAPGPWLYGTSDGGANWKPISLPVPDGMNVESVATLHPQFVTSKDGWLALQFRGDADNQRTLFYTTHDAGVTWAPVTTIPASDTGDPIYSFLDEKTGFATDGKKLYKLTDGKIETILFSTNQLEGTRQLQFLNEQTGYAVTANRVWVTRDGGHNWDVAW